MYSSSLENLVTIDVRIVMQNDIQQGAVNLQVPVVVDEAQLAEFIHEEAHARSCRADHFCEHFLADLGNNRLRLTLLAKVRQDKKHPSQTLFARIEQLINQIRLNPDIARQKVRHEFFGKFRLVVEYTDHGGFIEARNQAFRHSRCSRHAQELPGQASLAKEIARAEDCNNGLLSLLGMD